MTRNSRIIKAPGKDPSSGSVVVVVVVVVSSGVVEADVAVVPLKPSERVQQALERHFLPYESVLSERKAPTRNSVLTVIGFPLELGIEDRFFWMERDGSFEKKILGEEKDPNFRKRGLAGQPSFVQGVHSRISQLQLPPPQVEKVGRGGRGFYGQNSGSNRFTSTFTGMYS